MSVRSLAASVVLAVAVLLAAQTERAVPAPVGCETVDAATLDDASLASLLGDGWTGDPSDGAERLYSPFCQ